MLMLLFCCGRHRHKTLEYPAVKSKTYPHDHLIYMFMLLKREQQDPTTRGKDENIVCSITIIYAKENEFFF